MSKKQREEATQIKMAVGHRLQIFRNQQERTQEDVAYVADVHPSYIGKLETGKANWTIESLDNVLQALDVSYSELFHMIDETKSSSTLLQIIRLLEKRSIEEQKKALQLLKTVFN